jgi:hypothetical protein
MSADAPQTRQATGALSSIDFFLRSFCRDAG